MQRIGDEVDPLPVYTAEGAGPVPPPQEDNADNGVEPQTVDSATVELYSAIQAGHIDRVQLILQLGLVPLNIPQPNNTGSGYVRHFDGMTPLYAAVSSNQSATMFFLINAGADPNVFSRDPGLISGIDDIPRTRTPLMRAAADGNLRIVKDLVEQCNADPMLIAPDGQSAQRLAALNGHRDIVLYLPINRGGVRKRLYYEYHTRWRAIRNILGYIRHFFRFFLYELAKFFLYHVPKYLLWTVPKRLVLHIYKITPPIRLWPSIIMNALKKASHAAVDGVKAVPKFARKCYQGAKRTVKAIPGFMAKCYRGTKRAVKAIPGLVVRTGKQLGLWTLELLRILGDFVKAIGRAIGSIAKEIANLLVTVFMYIESLVKRLLSVTFQDVLNVIQHVLRVVFVEFPKTLYHGAEVFVSFVNKVLAKMFGIAWYIIYQIGWIFYQVIKFIPEQLGKIVLIIVQGIGKVGKECWLFFSPRSMM